MIDPDEPAALPPLHRLCLGVVGIVLLASAGSAIQSGEIKAGRSTPAVHRDTDPAAFWLVVGLETLLSLGAAFVALSGKNTLGK